MRVVERWQGKESGAKACISSHLLYVYSDLELLKEDDERKVLLRGRPFPTRSGLAVAMERLSC